MRGHCFKVGGGEGGVPNEAGYIPDVRVFWWPGSVFGARCSVLGVGPAQVPGTRSQVPGTQDAAGQSGNKAECLAHASKNPWGMQDAG